MTTLQKKIFYFAFGVKFFIAMFVPLVSDEFYYSLWGQNLQWSYFDHPPMVGWVMAFGNLFRGLCDGGIRLPFIALSQMTVWLWMHMSKGLLAQKQQTLFLWVLLLNPLTGWGGIIATPDIPLLFFWSLGILACQQIVCKPQVGAYFKIGAILGLGFLSKYMIVIFVPCVIAWAFLQKIFSYFLTPKVFLSILSGLLFCSPVVYWNWSNDWASFAFQWDHGTGASVKNPLWPLEYLLGQIFLVFPVFFIGAALNWRRSLWMTSFGFVPILFFLFTSFFARVEANWPLMAYPALYALALSHPTPLMNRLSVGTIKLWAFLLILVVSLPLWITEEMPIRKRIRLFEAEKYKAALPLLDSQLPTYVPNYQMASTLSFFSNKMVCKLPGSGRPDFFTFQKSCKVNTDSFLLIATAATKPVLTALYPEYQVVEVVQTSGFYSAYLVQRK